MPKHLHRIHLCQHQHQHQTDGMARSIINANWLNKHNKRAHPQLALMSTPDYPHYFEHQLRYSPQLDAYARAVMLDMVETILLPCCTQAPLDREFDFFKDSRLRVVGMTFLTSAGKCVMAEYAIKADRMFVSWSLRAQREKELASKSELELLVGAKVVVGGWNIGLEAIAKKEGRKEPWRTEWGMGVLFGKRY